MTLAKEILNLLEVDDIEAKAKEELLTIVDGFGDDQIPSKELKKDYLLSLPTVKNSKAIMISLNRTTPDHHSKSKYPSVQDQEIVNTIKQGIGSILSPLVNKSLIGAATEKIWNSGAFILKGK